MKGNIGAIKKNMIKEYISENKKFTTNQAEQFDIDNVINVADR